jgi:hypothetical protein
LTRFCANCGTEVDDTAAFCPTCGQPLDEATEVEMPPAPPWPESAPPPRAVEPSAGREEPPAPRYTEQPPSTAAGAHVEREATPSWAEARTSEPASTSRAPDEPLTQPVVPPPPVPPPGPVGPQGQPASQPSQPTIDLPITWPVMLSGWLIGVGAAVAALGALASLFSRSGSAWDVILVVLLLGIVATVFLASTLPAIPHLRLATLVIVLIGLGIALERVVTGSNISAVLVLGTAAAAIGAVIVELGRDQPLGGPRG